jgi:hypothetical protein
MLCMNLFGGEAATLPPTHKGHPMAHLVIIVGMQYMVFYTYSPSNGKNDKSYNIAINTQPKAGQ